MNNDMVTYFLFKITIATRFIETWDVLEITYNEKGNNFNHSVDVIMVGVEEVILISKK